MQLIPRTIVTFVSAFIIALVFSASVNAQYFGFPGAFLYALNHPKAEVFDISPDGKIGIVLRNDPASTHTAVISTFDPILGTQFDTKSFGFGPLAVRLAKVGNNLRAVVLTSEGGPRRVYLFNVSSTGQLTQITSTQLTTSGSDGGSNVVLSGSAGLGFVAVYGSTTDAEIISFSLNDGAIIKQTAVPAGPPESLTLFEGSNKRLLAFRVGLTLKVLDVLDPTQPEEVASVALTTNGEFSASNEDVIRFSGDGRFVFFVNQFFNFAAVDLNTNQVVGTLAGNYRFLRLETFEDSQKRLLAVLSSPAGNGGISALLLVDATNPSQIAVLNTVSPTAASRFQFAHDGGRLYVAESTRVVALDLPTFASAWSQPVPGSSPVLHQLSVYGSNDEILGAWSVFENINPATLGAFPAFPPNVSLSGPITVNESAGVADFTVSLSAPTSHRVNIKYSTANGTAEGGADYTITTGSLILQPGVTSGVISIPINDDALDESDETFTLNITAVPGIVTQYQTTATIVDNDPSPSISIADLNVVEGNSANNTAFFQVSLSAPSGRTITVDYATAANTATASDFVPVTGTLTFSPGQTVSNVTVQIIGDTLCESDETFFVNLSNPANATLNDAQAVGTIVDNDAPLLAIDATSQRAIALDSVTLVHEPFALNNPNYFDADKRTRIAIFSPNLVLTPGLVVTAQAVDSQQTVYQLPVEFVGTVPSFIAVIPQEPFLTKIVFRLPDGIPSTGDLQVSITTGGKTSAKVLIAMKP